MAGLLLERGDQRRHKRWVTFQGEVDLDVGHATENVLLVQRRS
jgi:hypothetical protein